MIREVLYRGSQTVDELLFRTLLFRLFNKIETWQLLEEEFGSLTTSSFRTDQALALLDATRHSGNPIYSAAYVIPPPRLGGSTKAANHLRLLEMMLSGELPKRVARAGDLEAIFRSLTEYPSIGKFLGFQLAIDLNYSSCVDFDEMDFVVAGPGARDGIRKCFGPESSGLEEAIIRHVAENQDEYFHRLSLPFGGLFGRPLKLIDCQNLFCELDKYARVAHPELAGDSGRTRIKQRFVPRGDHPHPWFPPKWRLNPDSTRA